MKPAPGILLQTATMHSRLDNLMLDYAAFRGISTTTTDGVSDFIVQIRGMNNIYHFEYIIHRVSRGLLSGIELQKMALLACKGTNPLLKIAITPLLVLHVSFLHSFTEDICW